MELVKALPPADPLFMCVDFIYADPPFFTRRDFSGERRSAKLRDYEQKDALDGTKPAHNDTETLRFIDRWQGGRHEYLEWLEHRIRSMKRLLAPRGVFLLHLDWHAVHYAKVLCDSIFGDDNFQNELIWYYQTGGASKDRFSRKHDTILLYSHAPTFHFDGNAIAIPRTPKALKRARSGKGARIAATDTHKNPDDVLTVPALNPMALERTGYPTQKPLALLELLIKSLCPEGGSVADLFCGSGTTLLAAKRLGRRYLGADLNPAAVTMTRARLAAEPSP
jgi:site-specific DNA-methyltransferase (adenine-specific)/adenine-specific DNA-methyltransferase